MRSPPPPTPRSKPSGITSAKASSQAERAGSKYRVYDSAQVEQLAFIRRCRGLDMTLDEVRALLRFIDQPGPDCGGVNAQLDEHISQIALRITELRRLEKQLRLLRSRCFSASAADACGILKSFPTDVVVPPALDLPARHRSTPHGHGDDLHRGRCASNPR